VLQHPIHWACVNGHIAVVDVLLQRGVNIDVLDKKGCSPLIVACQYGKTMLAGYLMGKGASTRLTDNDGDTALHWAAFKGQTVASYAGCKAPFYCQSQSL
jgi:ankyrin repeat protein